jgi:hypothetical protein
MTNIEFSARLRISLVGETPLGKYLIIIIIFHNTRVARRAGGTGCLAIMLNGPAQNRNNALRRAHLAINLILAAPP